MREAGQHVLLLLARELELRPITAHMVAKMFVRATPLGCAQSWPDQDSWDSTPGERCSVRQSPLHGTELTCHV